MSLRDFWRSTATALLRFGGRGTAADQPDLHCDRRRLTQSGYAFEHGALLDHRRGALAARGRIGQAHVCFRRYCMILVACASIAGGTTRPSLLAVLMLSTSSNLVGSATGISPGFSPFSMRPAKAPAWW